MVTLLCSSAYRWGSRSGLFLVVRPAAFLLCYILQIFLPLYSFHKQLLLSGVHGGCLEIRSQLALGLSPLCEVLWLSSLSLPYHTDGRRQILGSHATVFASHACNFSSFLFPLPLSHLSFSLLEASNTHISILPLFPVTLPTPGATHGLYASSNSLRRDLFFLH